VCSIYCIAWSEFGDPDRVDRSGVTELPGL